MSYSYERERKALFTDEGQKTFLEIRDKARALLNEAGAFRMDKVMGAGDTWEMLACVDRMIELGELKRVSDPSILAQHHIYTWA